MRAADRILVLRQGVILEQGDHDGLLQRGGHYAELYNTYFRHQALGYVPRRGWRSWREIERDGGVRLASPGTNTT